MWETLWITACGQSPRCREPPAREQPRVLQWVPLGTGPFPIGQVRPDRSAPGALGVDAAAQLVPCALCLGCEWSKWQYQVSTLETKPLQALCQDECASDNEISAKTGQDGADYGGKKAGSALTSTSVDVWRGEQEKGRARGW